MNVGHVSARRWEPLTLCVDPVVHAGEIARFMNKVVVGPGLQDCAIFVGAISDDGYGVFAIRRGGAVRVVRASRYALALSLGGQPLLGDVRALHECDNPVCARVVSPCEASMGAVEHIVVGDQRENMTRMARKGRGGGRRPILARGVGVRRRVERSLALREAVRDGWDADAVAAALLDAQHQLTLW